MFRLRNANRTRHTGYFLPKIEIRDNNLMIDGRNLSDQLVENDLRTYENIQKLTISQRDDYTISCLLDYLILKNKKKIELFRITNET